MPALAAVPASATSCDPGIEACRSLQQTQDEAASNRQRLADIETKLTDVRAQLSALAALLTSLRGQIGRQQAAVAHTQARLDRLEREERYTAADLARRQAQVALRQQLVDQRVRAADQQGRMDYLQLLVTSKSFTQLVDRLVLVHQVVADDERLVAEVRQSRDQVKGVEEQLAAERAQQASLLAEQRAEQDQLEQQLAVQQSAYAQQAQIESQYEAQRQAYEAQQAQISAEIPLLQAQYQAALDRIRAAPPPVRGGPVPVQAPPTPTGAQFIWPEASHLITQGFGCTDVPTEPYDPNCPTRHFHSGIDIAGPYGTPVYASAAGVATLYSDYTGYGNHVIMVHPGGYATLYGHLSAFAVGSGQVVAQGQVIGYEGTTGNSTGPHVHFEIRYNGAYQNPCAYVAC